MVHRGCKQRVLNDEAKLHSWRRASSKLLVLLHCYLRSTEKWSCAVAQAAMQVGLAGGIEASTSVLFQGRAELPTG